MRAFIAIPALLAAVVIARPALHARGLPDPAGTPNIGNGAGHQFIGGQCLNAADCETQCCATLGSIGVCSGVDAATQQGKTGCGFGGAGGAASSSSAAAAAPPAASSAAGSPPPQTDSSITLKPDPSGVKNIGNGKGGQFITGQCLSNADCASACCATLGSIGICSGPGASTQQGKTGCGFSQNGAAASASSSSSSAAAPPPPASSAPATPPPQTDSSITLKPDPAGVPHIGNGQGGQFITGQCLSNADCASACCATLGSIGICSGPGAATQQGKTGCGFTQNAAAASTDASTDAASSTTADAASTTDASSTSSASTADATGVAAQKDSGVPNVIEGCEDAAGKSCFQVLGDEVGSCFIIPRPLAQNVAIFLPMPNATCTVFSDEACAQGATPGNGALSSPAQGSWSCNSTATAA